MEYGERGRMADNNPIHTHTWFEKQKVVFGDLVYCTGAYMAICLLVFGFGRPSAKTFVRVLLKFYNITIKKNIQLHLILILLWKNYNVFLMIKSIVPATVCKMCLVYDYHLRNWLVHWLTWPPCHYIKCLGRWWG